VRYHPEDLSRIFVSADGRHYIEARYADLRRPTISLWEQRAAVRALRSNHDRRLSEQLIFQAIEQQREIVRSAARQTRRVRAAELDSPVGPAREASQIPVASRAADRQEPVPEDTPYSPYNAELW
jgi:putative transposase